MGMDNERDVMEPSAAMRVYLAEIFRLQEDSPTVSTTRTMTSINWLALPCFGGL